MLWRFQDSGIPRKELFICGSVVSNRASGFDAAKQATTKGWKRNMECFAVGEIDYLDQIMLDYPGPDCSSIEGELHRNFLIPYFKSKFKLNCFGSLFLLVCLVRPMGIV